MKNVASWIAVSLWGGGGGDHQAAAAAEDEAPMDDAAVHAHAEDEDDNPNDRTINYDHMDDAGAAPAAAAASASAASAAPARGASTLRLSAPAPAAASFSSPSPRHLLSSPASSSGISGSRLSFGSAAFSPPAASIPAHTFGRAAPLASPPSPAQVQHGMFAASPRPLSAVAVAESSFAAASATPDQILRAAFLQYESGATQQAVATLAHLAQSMSAAPAGAIDELVLSLVRRTGDSRHVTSQRAAMQAEDAAGEDADSALLTTELRQKAAKYDVLLRFVRQQFSVGAQQISLWSALSHMTQRALLQQGEFIECCLRLKQLLNAPAVSFLPVSDSSANAAVDASDQAQIDARRGLMLECMQYIVRDLRWKCGAEALVKEGLSVQEIFFSQTSKLPELFVAMEHVMLRPMDERPAPSTQGQVAYGELLRLHAATSLIHCVMDGATCFRSAPALQSFFLGADATLPRLDGSEMPAKSWMLAPEVAAVIRSLGERVAAQIVALSPEVRVVGFTLGSAGGFNVQVFQSHAFQLLYRMARIECAQYTEWLTMIEGVRQAVNGSLPQSMLDAEASVHASFCADRSFFLRLLTLASSRMNAYNLQLASVLPIPAGGLPGVAAVVAPPFQGLYDFAQEFQDLSALVGLSLAEPVRAVGQRRLVFFFAYYGHPFLKQLFEESVAAANDAAAEQDEQAVAADSAPIKDGPIARLLELAPLVRELLPSFLAEKAAQSSQSGADFTLPGPSGSLVRVSAQGVGDDGLGIYDSWLLALLQPHPQWLWLHQLGLGSFGDAFKVLRAEGHAERESVSHKKHLLSLSKLALLADAGESFDPLARSSSDASHALSGAESSPDASLGQGVSASELTALDDQLNVLLAQEFLASLYPPPEHKEQEGDDEQAAAPSAVLSPSDLLARLLEAAGDQSNPASTRVHCLSWCWLVLEKSHSGFPRSASAAFESFSRENQEAASRVWMATISAEAPAQWAQIAAAKARDSSDAWQEALRDTMVYALWSELMRLEPPCYGREHVYLSAFRRVLQSKLLPAGLQNNEVRVVIENAYKLARQHTIGS